MESLMNTDDFFFSAEEDALAEKVAAFFPKNSPSTDAAYMANVAIGNIKAERLNDAIGRTFRLCGYHAKKRRFQDGKEGKISTLFCRDADDRLIALSTTSEKVYEALSIISMIYRENIGTGIPIKIQSYQTSNQGTGFTLQVLDAIE